LPNHQTFLPDATVTIKGDTSPFLVGCQSAAISGRSSASDLPGSGLLEVMISAFHHGVTNHLNVVETRKFKFIESCFGHNPIVSSFLDAKECCCDRSMLVILVKDGLLYSNVDVWISESGGLLNEKWRRDSTDTANACNVVNGH
jgi:hypothetical protein